MNQNQNDNPCLCRASLMPGAPQDPQKIEIECPECKTKINLSLEDLLKGGACPKCGKEFKAEPTPVKI